MFVTIEIILRKKKIKLLSIKKYTDKILITDPTNLTRVHCVYIILFSRTVTDCNRRPHSRNTVVDTVTVERNSGGGGGDWRTESASAAALCAVVSLTLRTQSNFFFRAVRRALIVFYEFSPSSIFLAFIYY